MGDMLSLSEALAVRNAQPPQALSMVRFVRSLAIARSSQPSVVMAAGENFSGDAKLQAVLKAAVQAGTLTNLAALSPYQTLSNEFIEASRASSIVGRLTEARHVPLRIRVPRVTTGSTATWIGEGVVKPVTTMAFDEVLLDPKKNSVIVVTTDELVRFANAGSDQLLRNDLIRACNAAVDSVFIGTAAASASTPGGVLGGVTPVASTGSTAVAIGKDINTAIAGMITAGGQAQALVIIAHPGTWAQVGLTLGTVGGSLGLPVITSSVVPVGKLIVLDQAELLLGDPGEVELSLASEASVMMDSAPVNGTTAYTSLWQMNLVGIRAERIINWTAMRSNAATAGAVTGIA